MSEDTPKSQGQFKYLVEVPLITTKMVDIIVDSDRILSGDEIMMLARDSEPEIGFDDKINWLGATWAPLHPMYWFRYKR
jgi:hypothetical protein